MSMLETDGHGSSMARVGYAANLHVWSAETMKVR